MLTFQRVNFDLTYNLIKKTKFGFTTAFCSELQNSLANFKNNELGFSTDSRAFRSHLQSHLQVGDKW
jgi:hypothetical protein